MENLILIKLGGGLITDKKRAFYARGDIIRRLGKEILEARKSCKDKIILAHGSGSFGHVVAKKYKTSEGLVNNSSFKGLTLVADAAIKINRIVMLQMLRIGLPVVSFSPASLIFAKNREQRNCFVDPIFRALELNYLPVLYGDVVFDSEENGFCIFSSEKVLEVIAGQARGRFKLRILYCGDTEGVYGTNGETIGCLTRKSFSKIKGTIKGSGGVDVTGGMLHKVEESVEMATKWGVETVIFSGKDKGNLWKAIVGKSVRGTKITQ
ncbi:MAG: isopentenyl phosphate kinase [Patescibacteria group bacterium]